MERNRVNIALFTTDIPVPMNDSYCALYNDQDQLQTAIRAAVVENLHVLDEPRQALLQLRAPNTTTISGNFYGSISYVGAPTNPELIPLHVYY
jgi:hypothetical protein